MSFELEWFGGAPERRLRSRRADVSALRWGTFDRTAIPRHVLDAARTSFTEGAWNEYRAANAFAVLSQALLIARAPIDLTAMAADFVVDEMTHVELNARMAMELGGAAPREDVAMATYTETDDPIERAVEIAVRLSCVGEALSGPLLNASARAARHPLVRSVLTRLAAEERAHGSIGWLVLAWAGERMGDRERLARIARDEIEAHFADFTKLDGAADDPAYAYVGFVPPAAFLQEARKALRRRVARPLARFGIDVGQEVLHRLAPT